jgi:hypothetical protein
MDRFKTISSGLVIVLIIFAYSFSLASKTKLNSRSIDLAGLVVNAQTLLPIESATIYDAERNALGTTDKNGYFKITINYTKPGELDFKLKIRKQGFRDFDQHEHWGDLSGSIKNIMYFGLQGANANVKSFSSLADKFLIGGGLSYDNVLNGFTKVKEQQEFNNKLASAKAGNENVLLRIEGKFYIVDNGGWIQIGSDKDLISLNNKQALEANQLNAAIKRKDIKSMTPLDAKEEKYAIYTINSPSGINH